MYNKIHKTTVELIEILEKRGMKINDKNLAKQRLEHINYYKIKEFSNPFYKRNENNEYYYENISFEQVMFRFYEDKNLRIYLLHVIEKIELSFKTKIAYVLGEKYGAFGYLQFKTWCDKQKYSREIIEVEEENTKRKIRKLLKRKGNNIVEGFLKENPDCEFPPIWMLIEIIDFGDALFIYNLMSKQNKKRIADYYLATPLELFSWLNAVKFVRNLAAHNTNVIDARLITSPKLREEWKKYLFYFEDVRGNSKCTNKIAVVILVINHLIKTINPDYGFGNIRKVFCRLFKNKLENANRYGFATTDISFLNKYSETKSTYVPSKKIRK